MPTKKPTTKKSSAKAPAKKPAAKKAAPKKAATRAPAKTSPAKKPAAKKASPAKKPATKKPAAKAASSTARAVPKVSPARGQTVDTWAASKLSDWQRAVLDDVRGLVREAAPTASETLKWGRPVWEQNGPFAFLAAAKAHVTLGFWRGATLTDPDKLLEGEGERMAHLKIREGEDLNRGAIGAFVREAVELNATLGNPTMRG